MDPREQIKSKIDIVQFIQEYIPLKQTGRNFKALCPFHGEKTPSFVVSPERQIWHCFGCNLGGDCFTFLMEYEKMDFLESLRTLAKRTGVKLTTLSPTRGEREKERLLEINHLASEFYHYILTSHKAGANALDYLRKRGIRKETMKTFKLGFAPGKWDLLLSFLTKKKGFTTDEVEQAGLIVRNPKSEIRNPKYYDRFRNRIMFTLADHRGNVVGFAGRLLDPSAKEAHSTGASTELSRTSSVQAKYVNTPETPLYHKGELFYGLDVTKEAIKKENQAILVEGEFDMLASFQAGIANVVALKGTALTQMQAKLIRRFTQNIALAFDEDLAGDAAARRGVAIADQEGLNIKVIRVENGKDPDEVIQKSGAGIWKHAIKKAVSVYDFLIDSALSRFDKKTPEGKKSIADEVIPPLSTISNEIMKAHFVKRLGHELDVSEDVVVREMEKREPGKTVSREETTTGEKQRTRSEVLEDYFIALLLQKADATLMKKIRLEVEPTFFQTVTLRKVFTKLLTFYEKTGNFTIKAFIKEVPNEFIPTVDRLYLLDVETVRIEKLLAEIERVIKELRVLLLRSEMKKLSEDLKAKEQLGDERKLKLLKREFTILSSALQKLTAIRKPPLVH